MNTTIELPDTLHHKARAEAALSGRTLNDLIEEGLRRVLDAPRKTRRRSNLAELMADARGMIDSGLSDLGSNPQHLKALGPGSHSGNLR